MMSKRDNIFVCVSPRGLGRNHLLNSIKEQLEKQGYEVKIEGRTKGSIEVRIGEEVFKGIIEWEVTTEGGSTGTGRLYRERHYCFNEEAYEFARKRLRDSKNNDKTE